MTLNELGIEIARIREAVNSIEVKGEHNASLVVYVIKTCNDLVAFINKTIAESERSKSQAPDDNQNGSEVGDFDGE